LNGKGEHLICIDLQKETIRETHSRMEKEEFLASMNVNKRERGYAEDGDSENGPAKQVKEGKSRQVPSDDKVLKLAIKEFRGDKVLGLYEKDSRFVGECWRVATHGPIHEFPRTVIHKSFVLKAEFSEGL
jgi:hypothetical protein